MSRSDPMERLIEEALRDVDEPYSCEGRFGQTLDFFLPARGVYIEVKQFHSDRIAEQMSRAPNVIAAQGRPAVEFLAGLIRRGLATPPHDD